MTAAAGSLVWLVLLMAVLAAVIYALVRSRSGARPGMLDDVTAPPETAADAPTQGPIDEASTRGATATASDESESPRSRQDVVSAATQLLQTHADQAEFVVIQSITDARRYVELIPTGPATCDAQLSGQFSGPEQEGLRRWQFAALPDAGLFRRPGLPLVEERVLELVEGVFADVYGSPDDPLQARCCDPDLNQSLP